MSDQIQLSESTSTTEVIPRPVPNREIATIANGQDITRGFVGPLLIPQDRLLRNHGGSDVLVYEKVLSDPEVKTCFQQRRSAVVKCETIVDAASNSPADVEAADFIRAQLKATNWDNVTDKMLYGVFYGYAVAEIIYGVDPTTNLLVWRAIKVRNRRRFRFDKDAKLRLITYENMIPGNPCEIPYFWHFATGADNDDEPYGLGLGHWCYWPAMFMRNGLKFWLIFLEKFGMPTAIGKYDPNATEVERSNLLAALQAIQTDSGIIMPKDMEAALLEAARSGTADYEAMYSKMSDTIAKVIVGQTMTSKEGKSGGLAQSKVHHEVRQDIVKADADLICESFNLGPVAWICALNFPNAKPPRVYRVVEEPEDTTELADTDTLIVAMGFKPGLDYIQETYGAHWTEAPKPTPPPPAIAGEIGQLVPQPDPASRSAANFADPSTAADRADHRADQVHIKNAAADFAEQWHTFLGARLKQLQVLLDETGDLDLYRKRLAEFATEDPPAHLVTALQRAGFAAQLLARTTKQ